ncbi:MAG: hypothetical protein FWD48_00620 [Oscillospiraceae bacterium]|nr:hypothetical protein [Oscillospiraceae bacterium]
MKNKGNLLLLLFTLSGILFIASGVVDGDWFFIPIGLCFIAIGFMFKMIMKNLK